MVYKNRKSYLKLSVVLVLAILVIGFIGINSRAAGLSVASSDTASEGGNLEGEPQTDSLEGAEESPSEPSPEGVADGLSGPLPQPYGGGSTFSGDDSVTYKVSASVDENSGIATYQFADAVVKNAQYGSLMIGFPNGLAPKAGTYPGESALWYAPTVSATSLSFVAKPGQKASAAQIKGIIDGISLVSTKKAAELPDNLQVNITALSGGMSSMEIEGKIHYYKFVNAIPPTGQPQITWLDAYNAAKSEANKFSGMTGYMATITSDAEQNFIYNSIAKNSGWLGGTRLVLKGTNARISDQGSISNNIGDYDLSTTNGKVWYWADGPEAGKVFLNRPTRDGPTSGPVDINYEHFNGPEPNNSGNETMLQFAFSGDRWNDYNNTAPGALDGYYVEYGGYPGQDGYLAGYTQDLPAVVTIKYEKEDGGEAGANRYLLGNMGSAYDTSGKKAPVTIAPGYEYSRLKLSAETGKYTKAKATVVYEYKRTIYTLTHDWGGGSSSAATSQKVTFKDKGVEPTPLPEREGYTLNGAATRWKITAGPGAGTNWVFGTNTMPAGNVTVQAQWTVNQYRLTFDTQGGSAAPIAPPMDYGVTLVEPPTPSKRGYTFGGWFTKANGGGTQWVFGPSGTTMPAHDVTLYAKWSARSGLKIHYVGKQTDDTRVPEVTGSIADQTGIVYDTKVTPKGVNGTPPDTGFKRLGYTFTGWTSKPAANAEPEKTYNKEFQYNTSALNASDLSLTLYATWKAEDYKLTFDANLAPGSEPLNGYTVPRPLNLKGGETKMLPDFDGTNNPLRKGYTFLGWREEGGTINRQVGDYYVLVDGKDIVFYAQWEAKKNKISFERNTVDINGAALADAPTGTDPAAIQNVATDTKITLPAGEPYSLTGYTFDGWDLNGTTYQKGASYTKKGIADLVFKARWIPLKKQINYDANGGTGGPIPPKEYSFNTPENVATNIFTREGYTFKGWDTNKAATTPGYAYDGGSYNGFNKQYPARDANGVTLYAIWDANPYTLHYDANGGIGSANESIKYDETKTVHVGRGFSRPGYNLTGWSKTPDGGKDYPIGSQYTHKTAGEVTLYAYWEANNYEVSFDGNDLGDGATRVSGSVPSFNIAFQESTTLPQNGFVYPGYTFKGWSKTQQTVGGTAEFLGGGAYQHQDPRGVTLYAVWDYDSTTLGVTYDGNGGTPERQTEKPITYKGPVPLPKEEPTRLAYRFTGWYKDKAATQPWNFGADKMTPTDLTLYAGWERTDWVITFDVNGGDPTSVPSYLLVPITNVGTKEGTANLNPYAPGSEKEPYYKGYFYLGLTQDKAAGTPVPAGDFQLKRDLLVVANWSKTTVKPGDPGQPDPPKGSSSRPGGGTSSIPYPIPPEDSSSPGTGKNTVNPNYEEAIGNPADGSYQNMAGSGVYVTYKEESSPADVEKNLTANAVYTDIYGKEHIVPVKTKWNTAVLQNGGVELIEFYTLDSRGNEIISEDCYGTVFVLNRPFITARDAHTVFVGDPVSGQEYAPRAYAELPLLSEGRIVRILLPTSYDPMASDTNTPGIYDVRFTATFKDPFGKEFPLVKNSVLIVRKGWEKSEEDQQQSDSSEFWVKVTRIYHQMKPGQIIEVDDLNVDDGGHLLEETVPADAEYDRLIKVTPRANIYMNPCILDRIKKDDKGEMDVFLEGRSLSFHSKDYQTNPDRMVDPKSYFDLRMDVKQNEKVTKLVGSDVLQMQLHFEMDRPWMAEPYFTLKVSEGLDQAAKAGSILYLFNYNEETNELELVGPMVPANNGNYRIQMKGVYKDYVILAGLPKAANYRLTEKTNTLGKAILDQVGKNYVESGKAKTVPEGLNAASLTIQKIANTDVFDSLKEYEAFTGQKVSKEKGSMLLPILLGGISILGVLFGGFLFFKKKREDREQE